MKLDDSEKSDEELQRGSGRTVTAGMQFLPAHGIGDNDLKQVLVLHLIVHLDSELSFHIMPGFTSILAIADAAFRIQPELHTYLEGARYIFLHPPGAGGSRQT